jgi:hypothetical protein
LWIDQICINQADKGEQKRQIQMMGPIYRGGQRTVIFLGEDPDGLAKPCFEWMNAFQKWLTTKHGVRTMSDLTQDGFQVRLRPSLLDDSFPPPGTVAKGAVERLFQSPWIGRRWVVQEVALARKVDVFWGTRRTLWSVVAVSAVWLCDRIYTGRVIPFNALSIPGSAAKTSLSRLVALVMHIRRNQVSGEFRAVCIFDLLYAVHLWKTSIGSDALYSLSGLCPGKFLRLPSFQVDYSISASTVFQNFTREMIQLEGSLDILSIVQHLPDFKTSHIPSWVVRLDQNLRSLRVLGTNPIEFASSNSKASIVSTHDLSTLDLKGFRLSTVKRISEISPVQYHVDTSRVAATLRQILGVNNLSECVETYYEPGIVKAEREPQGTTLAMVFRCLLGVVYRRVRLNMEAQVSAAMLELLREEVPTPESAIATLTPAAVGGKAELFWPDAAQQAHSRRICFTDDGYLGLGPGIMEVGDIICILFGGRTPFVLRPIESGRYYMIGECFVPGVMFAEGMEALERGELEEERFILC